MLTRTCNDSGIPVPSKPLSLGVKKQRLHVDLHCAKSPTGEIRSQELCFAGSGKKQKGVLRRQHHQD